MVHAEHITVKGHLHVPVGAISVAMETTVTKLDYEAVDWSTLSVDCLLSQIDGPT